MNTTTRQALAAEAIDKCQEFRAAMNASKVGSKKWAEAEAELNFWQGKASMYQVTEGWAK